MAEYIDKEAFKKSVEERYCKPCKAEKKDHNGCWCRACWVDDMLDEVECFQLADVAPVVRCKDCKHSWEDIVRNDGTSIGKTVFLTREEAEKALEAMKDG